MNERVSDTEIVTKRKVTGLTSPKFVLVPPKGWETNFRVDLIEFTNCTPC